MLFKLSFFIWCIPLHPVKHEDSSIRCLGMRANIKSAWRVNKIFVYIFTHIRKLHVFPHIPQFCWKMLFWLFSKLNIKMSYPYRNFATKIIFKNSLWSDLIWVWKMAFILKGPVLSLQQILYSAPQKCLYMLNPY